MASLAVNNVPGINTFTFADFFALAQDGTLYADNLGPPAFEPFQQIVSVIGGHGVSLWRGVPAVEPSAVSDDQHVAVPGYEGTTE